VSFSPYCKQDGTLSGPNDPPLQAIAADFIQDYEGRRGGEGEYEIRNFLLPTAPVPCRLTTQLEHIPTSNPGGPPAFSIRYEQADAEGVTVWKDSMCSAGDNVINIDWAEPGLPSNVRAPSGRLRSMAYIFYYTEDIREYFVDYLGAAGLPYLQVVAFATGIDTTQAVGKGLIFITPGDSVLDVRYDEATLALECPMNCEWHEYAHYVFNNVISDAGRAPGDSNHGGYLNSSTEDSFDEGWAVFWPTAFKLALGKPQPSQYANIQDLEVNLQANSAQTRGDGSTAQREDLAVASLLWDVLDGAADTRLIYVTRGYQDDRPRVSPRTITLQDHVQMDDRPLYRLLVAQNVTDVFKLHRALEGSPARTDFDNGVSHSHRIWPGLGSAFDDIDELFLMHRFYYAQQVGPGVGPLGWTGVPQLIGLTDDVNRPRNPGQTDARQQIEGIAGAALRIAVTDGGGLPVPEATIVIARLSASPAEEQSPQRRLWRGGEVHYEPFVDPEEDDLVAVWVEAGGRRSDEVRTFTSAAYWDAVASGQGYAFAFDFTVRPDGPVAGSEPSLERPEGWPPAGAARFRSDTSWYVAAPSNGLATGETITVPPGVVIDAAGLIAAGTTVQRADDSPLVLTEPLQIQASVPEP
ncbi:MAG: hypothetical protein HYX51_05685, partial [Chloroflexi bacterium]|nr:hypothetical protein [Chloroflexota bacterium]